jgi:hypothetical protein
MNAICRIALAIETKQENEAGQILFKFQIFDK